MNRMTIFHLISLTSRPESVGGDGDGDDDHNKFNEGVSVDVAHGLCCEGPG